MDRIGILIDLMGKDAALNSLNQLKRLKDQLSRDKLSMSIDSFKIRSEINNVTAQIEALRRQKVELKAEAPSLNSIIEQTRSAKRSIEDLQNANVKLVNNLKQGHSASEQSHIQKLINDYTRLQDILAKVNSKEMKLSGLRAEGFDNKSSLKNAIKEIETELNKVTNKKWKLTIKSDFDKNLEQIRTLERAIENLNKLRSDMAAGKGGYEQLKALDEQINNLKKNLAELQKQAGEISLAKAEDSAILSEMNDQMSEAERNAQALADAFDNVAQAFNSIGDFFGDIAGIGSGFGNMLGRMAGMFGGGDILETVGRTLTYNATNAVTSRLGDIMKRYDIMRTFTPYMEIAGATAEESDKALKRINKSILGLPIGLDESAFRLRRYFMFTGDLEKATNLTIGLQKAITAGGASESMKTTALFQIDRLLSVGKLNTARQWNALINGLGVSFNFLKEAMGYAEMSNEEFVEQLTSSKGKIEESEVIEGLAALADETTEAGAKLEEATQLYKSTLESWMSNINFAITRGGESVLKGINKVSEEIFGEDLAGLAETFRDGIDDAFAGVDKYIEDNPELFEGLADSLEGLFGSLKKFSLEDIATKTIENLGDVIDTIAEAIDRLDPDAVEDFIAFATTWAGPLGKALTAISNGLPGMMAVFDRLRDYDWAGFVDTVLNHVDRAFSVLAGLLDHLPDGWIDNILAFAIVDAPILSKFAKGIGTVLTDLATIVVPVGLIGKVLGVGKIFKAIGGLFKGEAVKTVFNAKAMFAKLGGVAAAVGIIGEIAWVVREWSKTAQAINDIELTEGFGKKLAIVSTMTGIATVLVGLGTELFGAISASGAGFLALGAGELITGGIVALIAGVAKAVQMFAEAAQTISVIDITDFDKKVDASLQALDKITGSLAGKVFDADQAALAAQHIDDAVEHYANIKESLEKLKDIDKITIDFDAVTKQLTGAYKLVDEVNKAAGTEYEVNQKNNESLIYEQYLANMADSMGYISALVTGLSDTKTKLEELDMDLSDTTAKSPWEKLKSSINQSVLAIEGVFKEMETWSKNGTLASLQSSSRMPTIMTNMVSTLENLVPVFDQFKAIKGQLGLLGMNVNKEGKLLEGSSWDVFKTQLTDVVKFIGGIYGDFKTYFPQVNVPDSEKGFTEGDSVVENVGAIVDNLDGFFVDLKAAFKKMDELGKFMQENGGSGGFPLKAVVIKSLVEETMKSVEGIMEAITGEEKWLAGGAIYGYKNDYASTRASGIAFHLQNMVGYLQGMTENLSGLHEAIGGLEAAEVESMATKVSEFMPHIQKVMDAIGGMGFSSDQDYDIESDAKTTSEISRQAFDMKETMGSVVATLKNIADKKKMIEGLDTDGTGTKLSGVMEKLKESLDKIPDDMDEVKKKADNFKTAMEGVFQVIDWLNERQETLVSDETGEGATSLGELIGNMLSSFKGDDSLDSLATTASSLSETVSGITESISSLTSIGIEAFSGSLSGLVDAIEGVRSKLSELQTQARNTDSELDYLRSSVEACANMMSDKQGTLDSFKSHLDYVRNAANNAATQVNRLRESIDKLQSKTITVTTNYVRTGAYVGGRGSVDGWSSLIATGGPVYAARGQLFKPRGTDTVPAMLTPGEFVMRRAAVQKFGAGFMARLNQLNLDGALQLLYSARRLPQAVSSVINNSRTYDNHATVNQNIYTNNQRFSHRRAYRYLRTV